MRVLPAACAGALVLTFAVAGCAPKSDGGAGSGAASPTSCTVAGLAKAGALTEDGTLTVATDSPAYPPWFVDNTPTNGKGYESAVAYAVAEQLGFARDQVTWVKEPFNNSYAPGPKKFDFDINQVSITDARKTAVDFSRGYYSATQAVVAIKGSKAAAATSLAALAKLKLGAQTGTTSLTAARQDLRPTEQPVVFDDTNVATQALKNGQVDAIVADLPTAFYITGAELDDGVIVGQFEGSGTPEQFGLLTGKGSNLTPCLDTALGALEKDGTLAALEKQWLEQTVDVPVLK